MRRLTRSTPIYENDADWLREFISQTANNPYSSICLSEGVISGSNITFTFDAADGPVTSTFNLFDSESMALATIECEIWGVLNCVFDMTCGHIQATTDVIREIATEVEERLVARYRNRLIAVSSTVLMRSTLRDFLIYEYFYRVIPVVVSVKDATRVILSEHYFEGVTAKDLGDVVMLAHDGSNIKHLLPAGGQVFYEIHTYGNTLMLELEELTARLNKETRLDGTSVVNLSSRNRWSLFTESMPLLPTINIVVDEKGEVLEVNYYLPTFNDILRTKYLSTLGNVTPTFYTSPEQAAVSTNAALGDLLTDNPSFRQVGSNLELSDDEVTAIVKRLLN